MPPSTATSAPKAVAPYVSTGPAVATAPFNADTGVNIIHTLVTALGTTLAGLGVVMPPQLLPGVEKWILLTVSVGSMVVSFVVSHRHHKATAATGN